jgi:hypothetical protein
MYQQYNNNNNNNNNNNKATGTISKSLQTIPEQHTGKA